VTLTLLVDLDDTLLGTQMESFIRGYIGLLSEHMQPYVDPSKMVPSLMAATQQMVLNRRPDRTLEETFDRAFYPQLGIEKASVAGTLEQFYLDIYPRLQPLTFNVPGVEFLLEEARRRSWKVAIATNPLYPLQAILHRLSWAGVRWDQPPVEIVPSYETFHFAKPNPS
jgi:FMN phosphatase YigB (HAD superfamily)